MTTYHHLFVSVRYTRNKLIVRQRVIPSSRESNETLTWAIPSLKKRSVPLIDTAYLLRGFDELHLRAPFLLVFTITCLQNITVRFGLHVTGPRLVVLMTNSSASHGLFHSCFEDRILRWAQRKICTYTTKRATDQIQVPLLLLAV